MQGNSGPVTKQTTSLLFEIHKDKVVVRTGLQAFVIEREYRDRAYLSELSLAILMDEVICLDDVAYYTNRSGGKLKWTHSTVF